MGSTGGRPPLTIAQLLLPATFGGHQSVARALAGELAGLGHRVCVGVLCLPAGAGEAYADSLRAIPGVAVEPISVGRRGYVGERRAVGAWLNGLRPDVLHTHGYRPLVVDAPVARRIGLATVNTFHGFLGNSLLERLYERLEVRAARRVTRVIAVSREILARLERSGLPQGRVAFIPNASPKSETLVASEAARRALDLPSNRFVFGWVGRFSREKGLDVALRAHARLNAPRPLLAVIGDGGDRIALRVLSSDLGIVNDVAWLGAVLFANRYFPAFDAFVLSSRSEGSPMVLLEAVRAGIPIVATRVGEVAEITGEDGAMLVEPDEPASLALAMENVRSRRLEAEARAQRARSRTEALFSVGAWAERHLRLYAEAVAEGRQPRSH